MTIPDDSDLLAHIESFLAETGIGPAKFGVLAKREGGLVKSLRAGRSLSLRNARRILSFIETYPAVPALSGEMAAAGSTCEAQP